MGLFKRRKAMDDIKTEKNVMQMVTTYGEHYYSWNGKLYDSDIVRSCIRPKVKAAGKLAGKHIRADAEVLKVNPDANIRFLLSEPNPFMTGQQFQEKVATQLCLNNNAFILIIRDVNGKPMQLYPIPLRDVPYRTESVNSYKGIRGIVKKVCMWLLIVVGVIVDAMLNYAVEYIGWGIALPFIVATVVAVWLLVNEIISILENILDIGVTIPPFLLPLVRNIKKTVEEKTDVLAKEGEDGKGNII